MIDYAKMRENINKNVESLQYVFGDDSDISIAITENVVVYGIKGRIKIKRKGKVKVSSKTFYSTGNHRHILTIARYQKTITLSFLSDLSKEIASIIEE